jgi:hypothetical protein
MKMKLLAIIILVLSGLSLKAQNYTLETGMTEYQQLENDTILSEPGWVAQLYPINLPFSISVGNVAINRIFVYTDGMIYRMQGTQYRNVLFPYGNTPLRHREGDSTSHISYVVEGERPNRIAKVQFKNAGFAGDETHTDVVNFQVWFYEGGMRNEVIFGPVEINQMRAFNGAYGPLIGIGSQYLIGTPANTTLSTSTRGMNGVPPEGMRVSFVR